MYILVLALGVLGYFAVVRSAQNRSVAGSYGNCHRTNIQRATDNKNNYRDFLVFQAVVRLPQAPARKPTARATFLNLLENAIRGKEWIPLTNCMQAVDHPFSYVPPPPRTFYNKSDIPPPRSAFVLEPAN